MIFITRKFCFIIQIKKKKTISNYVLKKWDNVINLYDVIEHNHDTNMHTCIQIVYVYTTKSRQETSSETNITFKPQ